MKELLTILGRTEIVSVLIERDGDFCTYPECILPFTESGRYERTIDHTVPQSWAKTNGWTHEQIWDLSNLKLMHRSCNSTKSDRLPNPDGSLPPLLRDDRPRAVDKSLRIAVCQKCQSGRALQVGDTCPVCGSGAQPPKTPRATQKSPKECSHGWGDDPSEHCWLCHLSYVPRRPAIDVILNGP